jgi:transcriptional regulator with XRE-family HTH domain
MARLPKSTPTQPRARARFSDEYGLMIEMLVDLRLKAQITQQQMALQVGKSQSHVSMWEHRESEMSVIDVLKWCKAVGIGAGVFFTRLEKRIAALPSNKA